MKHTHTTLILLLLLLASAEALQAQTATERYWQLLSDAKEAYAEAVGYKVLDEIPLQANQMSSNATDYYEGGYMSYLLDNNASTYWHSDWHGYVTEPHYIQIDFAEPISCDLSLYVMRRVTSSDHPTRVGLYGSNDKSDWVPIGQFQLGNAVSGQSFTSPPLSLGGNAYSHLRLVIEETTTGHIFGHFAELHLYEGVCIGPSYLVDLGVNATAFKNSIDEAEAATSITWRVVSDLQQAYDDFMAEFARIKNGETPSFVQYSNLPSLFINTYDGSPVASKTNYQLAKMWRVDGESVEVFDSLQIRGRGNSTWLREKKPYRIKFSSKQKFLGKGYAKAKNWTLMANHVDKTLLRNALASFIAKRFGQTFVPAAVHVDVALNGEYIGNYQVSDHMDVQNRRVEIYEQESVVTDDETDISGGYFLQLDATAVADPVYFQTDWTGAVISVKSPDEDVINSRQKSYIQGYVNTFEQRLLGSYYTDPSLGYRPLVDSLSLASYFLTVEYSANPDGFYSIYFYKDIADPLFYWGPCWDYDIAFNNCYRLGELTNKMIVSSGYGETNGRVWFSRMFSDPWFKRLSGRIWHRAIADGLLQDALAFVDSVAQRIDESQRLNFERWSITQRTWDELVLFSTYQEGVDYLKRFLVDRVAYLSSQLPNPEGLQPPRDPANNPLDIDPSRAYYIYNVGSGMPVDFLADGSGRVCAWEQDERRIASQQWQIVPVTGDYYRIVSPNSRLAITDMATEYNGGYTTNIQVQLTAIDENNDRQLWKFVPTAGNYCIENKQTMLAWNNSGGVVANGNSIITWTNDENNAAKPTRQWYLVKGDTVDGIATPDADTDADYRIAYNPDAEEVRIHIPADATNRQGDIRLYDMQGRVLGTGSTNQPISMAGMPTGIYLLRWTVQGHSRSLKFRKP